MSFEPKDWRNDRSGGTKLNAAALIDLEERMAAYAGGGLTEEGVETKYIADGAVTEDKLDAGIKTKFAPLVNAEAFGAKGNGTTDDTAAIQAAITAAAAADVPLVIPPGTYKITSGLTAPNGLRASGLGGQTWFKVGSALETLLTLSSGKEYDLRDIGLDGNNLAKIGVGGALGSTSTPVRLAGLQIRNFNNPAENVAAAKSHQGISFTGGNGVRIEGCTVSDCVQGIVVENPAGPYFIDGNKVTAPGEHAMIGIKVRAEAQTDAQVAITRNHTTGANMDPGGNGEYGHGIVVVNVRGVRIEGNEASGNHTVGIFIGDGAYGAVVTGNVCRNNYTAGASPERGTGIYTEVGLTAPSEGEIAPGTGALIGLSIIGNTCSGNGTGMDITWSSGVIVQGNICYGSHGAGIDVGSDRCVVAGNVVYNNWISYTPTFLKKGGIRSVGRKCQFFGNSCFDTQVTQTQEYGISAKGDSRVGENDLRSNKIASLVFDSTNNQKTRWGTFSANASATTGTDTTPVAGTIYLAELRVDEGCALGSVEVLNGSAVGTDKLIVGIFDRYGTLLAHSALAGTTASGTASYQKISLEGEGIALTPGRYFIGLQVNGTTYRFRSIPGGSVNSSARGSVAGTFGTLPSITPPESAGENVGPIANVRG